MNNQEYFQKISETVHERRTKGELSKYEMEIFEEGKRQALKDVLIESGHQWTYGQLRKRCENMLRFLKQERNYGKLATYEYDVSVWENPYEFSSNALFSFVRLLLNDYQMRLKKAREIHRIQSKIINAASHLQIEGELFNE